MTKKYNKATNVLYLYTFCVLVYPVTIWWGSFLPRYFDLFNGYRFEASTLFSVRASFVFTNIIQLSRYRWYDESRECMRPLSLDSTSCWSVGTPCLCFDYTQYNCIHCVVALCKVLSYTFLICDKAKVSLRIWLIPKETLDEMSSYFCEVLTHAITEIIKMKFFCLQLRGVNTFTVLLYP